MDGDDERTDKESERSRSPPNNSKTNVTDSSSGENSTHHRSSEHPHRRRSSRVSRHRKSTNHEGLRIRASPEDDLCKEKPHKRRRRQRNNKPKHYKPYAKLSWKERKAFDEMESERATRSRANRPTPYNTTQFLMEDHKAETPDLTGLADANDNDTSEETFEDFRNGEYLEKNFSEAYDEVQNERLQSMSKEQLVTEVLALSKRVAELEESQRQLKTELGHEMADEKKSINPPLELGLTLNIGLPLRSQITELNVPHLGTALEKSA